MTDDTDAIGLLKEVGFFRHRNCRLDVVDERRCSVVAENLSLVISRPAFLTPSPGKLIVRRYHALLFQSTPRYRYDAVQTVGLNSSSTFALQLH